MAPAKFALSWSQYVFLTIPAHPDAGRGRTEHDQTEAARGDAQALSVESYVGL
jgi:hypothetical protein